MAKKALLAAAAAMAVLGVGDPFARSRMVSWMATVILTSA